MGNRRCLALLVKIQNNYKRYHLLQFMTLTCRRCNATGEGDKVDIHTRLAFVHEKGCGSGIGPLFVSGKTTAVIQTTTSDLSGTDTSPIDISITEKPKKKKNKKKKKKKSVF